MRQFAKIAIAAAILTATTYFPASARNYMVPKAYMFGFVASFNDSIIYFTDIQEVDSVWLTQKKKMLAGRSNYAYQLRNYCSQALEQPNRTVVIISATKRKDVEKKLTKMKKQYVVKNAGKYDIRYIPTSDFKFQPVNMDDSTK
ncbi:MAG: hypothetical protein IJ618_10130 [Prevotella sp.]|nr:hypothetical protein [Prevotella sp.]